MNKIKSTLVASVCSLFLFACGSDSSPNPETQSPVENVPVDTSGNEGSVVEEGLPDSSETENGSANEGITEEGVANEASANQGGAVSDAGNRRLTLTDSQQQLNADVSPSSVFAITDDNRYLLFSTSATNALATGDIEDSYVDVYLRDTVAGSVTKVSQAIEGSSNDGNSLSEGISADGRYSVITSFSKGIHPDANGSKQVYLYDALSQATTLISRAPAGDVGRGNSSNPFISANGATVLFNSRAQNINDAFSGRSVSIFIYDVASGVITELMPESSSNLPAFISAVDITSDARFVLFATDVNNDTQYVVLDRDTNNVTTISDDISSSFGLRISDSGRYVVAQNGASTERPIVRIDLQQDIKVELGLDTLVPNWAGAEFRQIASPGDISKDGQTITYYGILFDGQVPATSNNSYWNVYALNLVKVYFHSFQTTINQLFTTAKRAI